MSGQNPAAKLAAKLKPKLKPKPREPPKPKTIKELLPHTLEAKTKAPRVKDPDLSLRLIPFELVIRKYGQDVFATVSVNPEDHKRLLEAFPGTDQGTLAVKLISHTRTGLR